MVHARLDAALRALATVGALSAGEARYWHERAFSPPPDALARPQSEKTHMARVIDGTSKVVDGLQLTLIELYTDGITLNWHERAARLGERAMRRVRNRLDHDTADISEPSLTDDLGSSYVFCGGRAGTGTGNRATIGHSDFAPAPPAAVRSLVFESLGRQIPIRLNP